MNKTKVGIILGACILGISLPNIAMAETSSRRANIKSSGNIDFEDGEAYISASDLTYLADEIDNLEDTYKQTTVNSLNDIGTFFLSDGTVVNDVTQNEVDTDEEKASLSFGKIAEGIRNSQSVESDQAANANNLSAGTAAWVNGTLIKGNGSDNAAHYSQGFIDGQQNIYDNLQVSYTYHQHEGDAASATGCYVADYHTHLGNSISGGGCYSIVEDNPTYGGHTYRGNGYGYDCPLCGAVLQYVDSWGDDVYTSAWDQACPKNIIDHNYTYSLGCGKTTDNIEGYVLGCGKTEESIESATIIY